MLFRTKRITIIFIILAILNLAAALDATSLSVALPRIAKELNGSAIEAFWSGTSFLVTSTVFQPIICSVSDIFGRGVAILASIAFFMLGAILAGISHGFRLLLAGRSLQGVGAGGIIALTEVILTDLIPLRQRGKWLSIISASWAVGSVCGPLVGGVFAQLVTWRWIFWINLPFAGIGVLLVPMLWNIGRVRSSIRPKLAKADYIGCILFTTSLTSFLLPLTWGGVMYAWNSWHTILPLVLGFCGLVTFIVYEKLFAVSPLIPLHIFHDLSSSFNYLGCFLHGMLLWSVLYYLPLYYEAVLGYKPIISAVALLPETFTVAPASGLVGILITLRGHYRWEIWIGWILTTTGTGLLYLLDVETTIPQWIFLNIVGGLGTGILFSSLTLAIQASAPENNMAIAVTMTNFFRSAGQAIGVAVGGVVFQNSMKSQLRSHPQTKGIADHYAKDASALAAVIKTLPADLRYPVKNAYAEALATLWAVMCGFAGLGLITSVFVKEYQLGHISVHENPLDNVGTSVPTVKTAEEQAAMQENGH
ncbi:major facilitator superfamily domain-containing protein [Aspergillus pseudotamarii]|uniref:Major facilitator superfamily domain-containing protein n=1 Tax=Aspergillus pseudotamarii TaxID=132259 RepID=A0A5N6SRX6_ASPPS|nr:major facilitator superfamily domain-containing protein [Aspergillus pseudotamarii]KAE8136541.1 major facilitator superfamily domain-containing protein [Aspergillus pseudotamarii]